MYEAGDSFGPVRRKYDKEAVGMYKESLGLKSSSNYIPSSITARDYAFLLLENRSFGKGGIHVKQRSRFYKPIPVGGELEWKGQITEIHEKNNRKYITFQYEGREPEGDVAVVHEITFIPLDVEVATE